MKWIKVFAFVFLCFNLMAQNPLPRTKLPSQYITYDINNEADMPKNKYLGYLFAYDESAKSLIWYAKTSPELIILQQKFKPSLFQFQTKSFSRCEYKNDKIYLCSRILNKGEEVCGVFNWENFKIEFEKETRFDPNPILLKEADSLLAAKKFAACAATLNKVSYFSVYANPALKGAELLKGTYDFIETSFIPQNKFKNALELMKQIMPTVDSLLFKDLKSDSDFDKLFAKKFAGMTKDECTNMLLVYMEWHIKQRDYAGFLSAHSPYMKITSTQAKWYLLRGDAYYGKGDKAKAKDNYIIYKDKMTAAKKEKDIPPYIIPRSK